MQSDVGSGVPEHVCVPASSVVVAAAAVAAAAVAALALARASVSHCLWEVPTA